MKVDLDKDGLEMFFKPWQAPLIVALLKEDVEMKTAEAHEYIKGKGFDISRASVIFFLRDMGSEGLLVSRKETGKGGEHSIYRGTMRLAQFYNDMHLKFDGKIGSALRILRETQSSQRKVKIE